VFATPKMMSCEECIHEIGTASSRFGLIHTLDHAVGRMAHVCRSARPTAVVGAG
jgi:hypothetical protein